MYTRPREGLDIKKLTICITIPDIPNKVNHHQPQLPIRLRQPKTYKMMNLSIYAIPVYYILSIVPHTYAFKLIISANNGRWDNSNPRSPKTQAAIEKSVPAATFARYVGVFSQSFHPQSRPFPESPIIFSRRLFKLVFSTFSLLIDRNNAALLLEQYSADSMGSWQERAEAAHKNCMENMPLFTSAVILGNLAQLPAGTLNVIAGSYLLLRVAYAVAYINISHHKGSRVRTGIWATSSFLLLYQIVIAGNVLARKHGS